MKKVGFGNRDLLGGQAKGLDFPHHPMELREEPEFSLGWDAVWKGRWTILTTWGYMGSIYIPRYPIPSEVYIFVQLNDWCKEQRVREERLMAGQWYCSLYF